MLGAWSCFWRVEDSSLTLASFFFFVLSFFFFGVFIDLAQFYQEVNFLFFVFFGGAFALCRKV